MSRCKPKLPKLPSPAYSRNQSVKFIRTDRGQHDPAVVRHLSDLRGL